MMPQTVPLGGDKPPRGFPLPDDSAVPWHHHTGAAHAHILGAGAKPQK